MHGAQRKGKVFAGACQHLQVPVGEVHNQVVDKGRDPIIRDHLLQCHAADGIAGRIDRVPYGNLHQEGRGADEYGDHRMGAVCRPFLVCGRRDRPGYIQFLYNKIHTRPFPAAIP